MSYRTGGTGIQVVLSLPKCSVPVLMSYRTYGSVRYRYWCRTERTEVSGTGIGVVPNLSKCPVPVLMSYWTYRSVRYRYWCRTDLTGVSGTGIDVPNLPKCLVPVIPAVYTAGLPWYLPYRTHPSLCAVQKVPSGLSNWSRKWNIKTESPWSWKKTNNLQFFRLILMRIRFRASYFGQGTKTNLVCANRKRFVVRNRTRRRYPGRLFVCSCDSSAL